jgi:chromosome segregation ATPase
MNFRPSISGFAAVALICATGVPLAADVSETAALRRQVAELRDRNRALEHSLAEANRAENQASEQLGEIRARLEALGADLLEGGDDRLVAAIADVRVLNERLSRLEERAMRFSGAVVDYLRQSLAADPDARVRVERSMRELDEVLGLRQKPSAADDATGSARRARVLSIDPESGLLVLNRGTEQGVRIGTTYRLHRGDQPYGTAVIADARRRVAGAFVESREDDAGPVRLGDTAILETE